MTNSMSNALKRGNYSGQESIQGRILFKEIWHIKLGQLCTGIHLKFFHSTFKISCKIDPHECCIDILVTKMNEE